MKKDIIIWGGTGNFKVLSEFLINDYNVLGYFDRNKNIQKSYNGINYLGDWSDFELWIKKYDNHKKQSFIVSIGAGYGKDRLLMHQKLRENKLIPIIAVHPSAFIEKSVLLKEGTQVYSHATICVDAIIGKGCIVNTAASIDHECVLAEGVSIGPGARLAGLVKVEKYADIYTGAIILPRITIGQGAVVGAGSVVIKDIEPYSIVVGNPARVIKKRVL